MIKFYHLIMRHRSMVAPPAAAEDGEGPGARERLVLAGSQLLSRRERAKALIRAKVGSSANAESDGTGPGGRESSNDASRGSGGNGSDGGGADGWGPLLAGAAEGSLAQVFMQLMSESGYEDYVRMAADGSSTTRWRNIGELASMAAPYSASELQDFLDQVALVSDLDATDAHGTLASAKRAGQEPVKLMSVHASKGLEFDAVFLIGVEEDLMPHYYAETRAALEEERRLLYVAMTRARQYLSMSYAVERSRWGRVALTEPSRFLADLPEQLATRRTIMDRRDCGKPDHLCAQRRSARSARLF